MTNKVIAIIVLALVASGSLGLGALSGSQPSRFEFFFNGPSRGLRIWAREGDVWTETYPSGARSTFRVRNASYVLHGITGTLVGKADEPDFFVFIPDLRSSRMEVWSYKARGPWRFLGAIYAVSPQPID